MSERHFTPEELVRYHDGLLPSGEAAAVESHLWRCAACSQALGVIRTFDEALADEEVWHFAGELETRRAQARLGNLAEQIAREDEEAERLLRPHLSNPFLSSGRSSQESGASGPVASSACSPGPVPRRVKRTRSTP